jgi:hypothetical protein
MGIMKRLWIIPLAAALCPLGLAQSVPISGQVLSEYGSPVAGAQVYICSAAGSSGLPCTPVASIFQDYNLAIPAANPTQTDANGNFSVYVPALAFPNAYVVNMVTGYGPIYTQLYPGPSCFLSGCTFTGNVTAPLYNATLAPYYEINGVQIASTNLLDAGNIAYLNAANTFTGGTQTASVWNATTGFKISGVPLASTNLSDTTSLAYLSASNTFTGTTNTFKAVVGTTITGTTINATTGLQVGGVALSATNLSNGVSGTGAVCLASGSACGYYQTVALAGTPVAQESELNFVSGLTVTDDPTNGRTNVSASAAVITRVQIVLPVTSISANSCTSAVPVAATGATSTSTFSTAFTSSPLGAIGWAAQGGLVVELWPDATAGYIDWSVCNQTSVSITPTARTLEVGVI